MKPRITHDEVVAILKANNCDLTKAAMLSIRGYYLDSEGVKGKNDRGIFDDAWIFYSPQYGIVTYRANTDPTGYHAGTGTGANKGRASLASGVWLYGVGLHKGRPAFRQCAPVLVKRDKIGGGTYDDLGWHAINIHDAGSGNTTSSLGCQTLPKVQFAPMRETFVQWMRDAGNKKAKNDFDQSVLSFEYCLLEETERRKGNLVVPNHYKTAA